MFVLFEQVGLHMDNIDQFKFSEEINFIEIIIFIAYKEEITFSDFKVAKICSRSKELYPNNKTVLYNKPYASKFLMLIIDFL